MIWKISYTQREFHQVFPVSDFRSERSHGLTNLTLHRSVGFIPDRFVHPTGFNFADILCMVWRCACGLDIMLIFFSSFSYTCELSIFCLNNIHLLCATPSIGFDLSVWNFAGIFYKVWGCAWSLDLNLIFTYLFFVAFIIIIIIIYLFCFHIKYYQSI